MYLDIRLPIGILFGLLGLLLAGYGVLSDPTIYQRSLGYNVNLVWGLVLLGFGLLMLVFGRRRTSGVRRAESTPEGRAIEASEHRSGL
jgi:tellurite resistance protein TehA-like permease